VKTTRKTDRTANAGLTAAAVTLLQTDYPGLTPEELAQAIRDHRRVARTQEPTVHRPDEALTITEVARRLSCSKRSVWRMIETGELRAVKISARVTRVRESEFERLLDRAGGAA
jgi:excisionase family DNA binding protein